MLAGATAGAGNGVGGATTHTVCTVLPSARVVTLGFGFAGVFARRGGGWVTVAAVCPLGQVVGAGVRRLVGSAAATGAAARTASPASDGHRAAAKPSPGGARRRHVTGRVRHRSAQKQRVRLPNGHSEQYW